MDEIEDKNTDTSGESQADTATETKADSTENGALEFREDAGAKIAEGLGSTGASEEKAPPPPTPSADSSAEGKPANSAEDDLAYAQAFYDKLMGVKDGLSTTQKVKISFHDYKKLYRAKLTDTAGDNQPLRLKNGPLLDIDTSEGAKSGIFDFTVVD